jgi:uncharacterized protein (UPF0303 family)
MNGTVLPDTELHAELLRQESLLVFERFDNQTALALGQQMLAAADSQGLVLTIDITRCSQQIFHAARPGTIKDFDHWIMRKREMVYRMGHSSWFAAVEARLTGEDLVADYGLDPAVFSAAGGGFPVYVKHVGLVGTITVSGLAAADDHQFIIDELAKFLGVSL